MYVLDCLPLLSHAKILLFIPTPDRFFLFLVLVFLYSVFYFSFFSSTLSVSKFTYNTQSHFAPHLPLHPHFQFSPRQCWIVCALFWAQVFCDSTQWDENKVTFLIEFGAWEDVDLSLAKLSLGAGSVAGVHYNFGEISWLRSTSSHAPNCKKGTAVFSSLSSIRWDLSPK